MTAPTTARPNPLTWAAAPTVTGPPPPPQRDLSSPPPPPPEPPTDPEPSRPGGRRGRTGGGGGLRAALAGGLVGALVAGGVAYGTVRLTDDDTAAPAASVSTLGTSGAASTLTGDPLDIQTLVEKVSPSVVNIAIGAPARNGSVQQVAAGSGVIISADGLVLTNAHVVQLNDAYGRSLDGAVITVKLSDGSEREATVLGADSSRDIAVLRLADASNLTPATLGDSDALRVGDDVVAIGNALDLGDTPTVTKGIVSATGRTLTVDANTTLTDLIQTDAPINQGNSGGALVNAAGELVGINSAGIPQAENLGFAIAINTIKPLLDQLEAGESTAPDGSTSAYLGVSARQALEGVTVAGVADGSAAADAGLQPGDVIVGIDGTDITTVEELGAALAGKQPGDQITVDVARNGETATVRATLGSRTG